MEPALPVRFEVTYRLREYLDIVRAHTFANVIPVDVSRAQRIFYRAMLTAVGTLLFVYKSNRVGTCSFTLDAVGVTRRSKCGEVSLPWADVTVVHQYGPGYLIAKKTGAMPIPFSALSEGQKASVAALVAPYLRTPGAT